MQLTVYRHTSAIAWLTGVEEFKQISTWQLNTVGFQKRKIQIVMTIYIYNDASQFVPIRMTLNVLIDIYFNTILFSPNVSLTE